MKIKNVSGDDRIVPALNQRLVMAGAVVDCPDSKTAASFLCQVGIWEAADDEANAVVNPPEEPATTDSSDAPSEG